MAVTNYKFAGTAASVSNASDQDWDNPNYAKTDDTSYASSNVNVKQGHTDYLLLTNFGFSSSDIPEGATINGIEFVISRKNLRDSGTHDEELYLQYDSANVGNNLSSASDWPISISEATYGGSNNMCGTSLTQAQIVSSSFGIKLRVTIFSNPCPCEVDYIKIRVYYTAGGGSTVFLPNIMKHNFIPPLIGGY